MNSTIQQIQDHLARSPNDGLAWFSLAQMLAQGPPGQELYHAIEQSIKSLPEDYQVWLLAGNVHLRERGISAALAWLDHTARQNPRLAAPQLALATLQASQDPTSAIGLYQRVIGDFPKDSRAHVLLAGLQHQLGDFDQAEKTLQQALKIKPDSADYWAMLANIQLVNGQLEAAVGTASRALKLDGNMTAARITRADARRQSGKWENALQDYRKVEKTRGKDPALLNNIGSCLAGLEQLDSAAEYFHKALRLDPDLVQARLNVGLLSATQLKADDAISQITRALKDPTVDSETRRSAQLTVDILLDHKRLKPCLEKARQTADTAALQLALGQTPAGLLRPDRQTLDRLEKLAVTCRQIASDPQDFTYSGDPVYLPFIEACSQCKYEGDAAELVQKYLELLQDSPDLQLSAGNREILNVWNANRERQKYRSELLQQQDGEAWLRYWHARLLHENQQALPGQYKPITNAIGSRSVTPPEGVAGTFRELLTETLPTVPGGLARGVFMLVATTMIHGFGDGNGRLARFMLGWELESAGLPAITMPLSLRQEAGRNINAAWDESGIEPLLSTLGQARNETGQLLQQFRADQHLDQQENSIL